MYHTAIPSAIPNGWHLEEEKEGGGGRRRRNFEVLGVPGYHLRWLGFITLLLSATASYTTGLGATFGDFDLAAQCRERVFAWSATFPWNRDGRCRVVGPLCPHIRRFDALDILVQLFHLGEAVHVEGRRRIEEGRGGGIGSMRQVITGGVRV